MNSLAIIFISYISSFFSYGNHNKKMGFILYFITAFAFAYFIGIRSIDVPDTEVYVDFYNNTNPYIFSDFNNSSFEIGFQVLTKVLKIITGGYVIYYFMLICLINFSLFYFSLKNFTRNQGHFLSIGLNLYLAFFGLFYNSIVLRQGIALSLICYAISLTFLNGELNFKKNKKKITISLFLAVSLHLSSVIGILVWFLFKKSKGKSSNYYIILLILSMSIYFFKIGAFFTDIFVSGLNSLFSLFQGTQFAKYLFYQDLLKDVSYAISFKILFFYFVAGLIILLHNRDSFLKENKLFRIYMMGVFLISFLGFIEQISRALDYFMILSVFLLFGEFIKMKKFDSRILFLIIVLGIQFFFVFRIINGV